MTVEVRLFAYLSKYLPPGAKGKRANIEMPNPTKVSTLARQLGIPEDLTSIVLVNGRHSNPDAVLEDGDVVSIFPPVAGG